MKTETKILRLRVQDYGTTGRPMTCLRDIILAEAGVSSWFSRFPLKTWENSICLYEKRNRPKFLPKLHVGFFFFSPKNSGDNDNIRVTRYYNSSDDLPTDGLNMPNGSPTDSFLAKSSAKAFVNVYVFGHPSVKLYTHDNVLTRTYFFSIWLLHCKL